jgi:hypothetical protein
MSSTGRDQYGQYAKRRSPLLIIATFLSGILSIGLLVIATKAVLANFAAYRSCEANNSGLVVVSCGKQGLTFTDIFLVILMVLAATLVVTLFTATWRMMRRRL